MLRCIELFKSLPIVKNFNCLKMLFNVKICILLYLLNYDYEIFIIVSHICNDNNSHNINNNNYNSLKKEQFRMCLLYFNVF